MRGALVVLADMAVKKAQGKGAPGGAPDVTLNDHFFESKDVLAARRRELDLKYPAGNRVEEYERTLRARDALFLEAEVGNEEAVTDARDIILLDLVRAVDANEEGARPQLHRFLADELHGRTITVTAARLLADMHSALARGADPGEATLMAMPGRRPTTAGRDFEIRRFLAIEDAMRELQRAAGGEWRSRSESVKEAARIFGVGLKRIQNIAREG